MLRRLEKYELLEEIGHGGMATVYRAQDTRLEREVALKVLHPHLQAAEEARSRFAREARSVARLRHPNILEVYDYSGEDSDESYIAGELLTGPTLKRYIESGVSMPAEMAACFTIPIASALAVAHEEGIIHRDVKPENVLLHENRTVKLTDFGIAQMVDAQSFTATGQILGSPGHMAPEQVDGRPCDARTDVFSLGTVLYYLAVGRLPFTGRNPHHVLKRIMDGDYPDPLRLRPSIGGRLRAIIRRALATEPDDRYGTAAELEADLREFVAEVGIEEPHEALQEFLADPAESARSLERRVVERLTERGQRSAEEGHVPAALDDFGRALAIDEGNERVLALIDQVGKRDRRRRRSLILAGVGLGALGLVLAAVGYTVASHRTERAAAEVRTATPPATGSDAGTDDAGGPSGSASASSVGVAARDRDAGRPADASKADASKTARQVTTDAGRRARSAPVPDRSRRPRTVVFRPTPQNVLISIDGSEPEPFGRSWLDKKLPPGRHHFRFIGGANCCETEAFSRVIPPGPGTTEIAPRLDFKPARVYVVANVPGSVRIDGDRAAGRVRNIIRVPMDDLTDVAKVNVTAPGHRDYTGQVRLRAGELTELDVTLEASESGR